MYKIIKMTSGPVKGTGNKGDAPARRFSQDEIDLLWQKVSPLLGYVNLRQPTLIPDQAALEKYPEMADVIGGISISTKETYINLLRYLDSFGPFCDNDWLELTQWFSSARLDVNDDKVQVTLRFFDEIAGQVNSGRISKDQGAFLVYMSLLLAHEMGHHKWIPYDVKNSLLIIDSAFAVTKDQEAASYLTNAYEDLVINNRLFQERRLPFHLMYKRMAETKAGSSRFWQLYISTYQTLFGEKIASNKQQSPKLADDVQKLAQIIADSRTENFIENCGEAVKIMKEYFAKSDAGGKMLDRDITLKRGEQGEKGRTGNEPVQGKEKTPGKKGQAQT
ncbi:MAG: hypothetical protein WC838_07340, partial [Candidatus Margulisiibacteriota bacterium]